MTLGGSASMLAVGLLLATASLGFVTGFHPGLRYGLVPAAFILLAPGGEVLEKAWHGAAAIGIGAVVGALSGLLVFPEPAHRAVERHLGQALGRCGDLLGSAAHSLLGEGALGQLAAAADAVEASCGRRAASPLSRATRAACADSPLTRGRVSCCGLSSGCGIRCSSWPAPKERRCRPRRAPSSRRPWRPSPPAAAATSSRSVTP
jgi:hypothetical protein